MKLFILALCIASAAAFGTHCKDNSECEEGECCVNYFMVSFLPGHCKKLKEEGESCTPLVKKDNETPSMYHFSCPCKSGLNCEATHEIEVFGHIVKHKPECVVPGEDGKTDSDDNVEVTTEGIDEIGEPEAE